MNEILKENGIQIFDYNNVKIRTVTKDNEIWWVLKDICVVLELDTTKLKQVADRLEDDEKGRCLIPTIKGKQETWIVNESGLYNVILRSDKPEAKPFRKWVTSEVLPSIRKHGAYITPDTLENMISSPEFGIRLLTALQEEQNKRKALEIVMEEQKPLVDFANQVSLTDNLTNMNKMAKLLSDKGVNIGQNRLFRFLREEKILMSNNVPYQQYIDKGYFVVKESVKEMGKYSKTIQTTLVTGKGQQFVCKKVLKDFAN